MGRRSRNIWVRLAVLGMGMLTAAHAQYYEDTMEPAEIGIKDIGEPRTLKAVYAGNDVCRLCHEAAYQTWLGTGHSRGFLPLDSMMGMMMGEKMGITGQMPSKSGQCLTCHALAHDVPAAYRGPGFRMGEGVACERCHGPGGEHVSAIEDPESGAESALAVPGPEFCRNCHRPKTAHDGVESRIANFPRAWKKIAHPLAMERADDEMEPAELGVSGIEEPTVPEAGYVGPAVCGRCHEQAYRTWRQTAHARSFKSLFSEMAYAMDLMGEEPTIGGPAKNGMCLSCHATGHDAPAAYRNPGFRMAAGVGCEKCHGPGADHLEAMEKHREVPNMGLRREPTEPSCTACHKRKRSHAKLGRFSFDPPEAWDKIAH